MLRSALHLTKIAVIGATLVLLVILLGFFVSPSAVRISPVTPHDSLLLQRLR